EGRRVLALEAAVQGALEQDRAQDPVAVEGRAGDDALAHPVHQAEHFILVRPRRGLDAIEPERLRGAAAALVERRDETLARGDPVTLLLIHCHVEVLSSDGGRRSRSATVDDTRPPPVQPSACGAAAEPPRWRLRRKYIP